MVLTWKKWTTFFVIAILAALACHLYFELHLKPFYYVPCQPRESSIFFEMNSEFRPFQHLVRNMMRLTDLPWPITKRFIRQEPASCTPAVQSPLCRDKTAATSLSKGDTKPAFENYVRASWLTWWLGMTGLILAGTSIVGVAIYILLARGKYLGGGELNISYKLLELGIGTPIFIMVWMTMVIPLDLGDYYSVCPMLTWSWVWMLLWIIFIGLLALFSSSESEGIRRSPGRRIWVFTAMGVAAGCIVASIISPQLRSILSIGIAASVIGVGFFIWFVVVMICWLTRRSQEDLVSRARANLAFAVCSMIASAVFLIAALLSMPLTRYQQEHYESFTMQTTATQTQLTCTNDQNRQ
jgi:hypothetical protein